MTKPITNLLRYFYGPSTWAYKPMLKVHSQKRASCSKSAAGLLPCSHQADIRMRSHCLPRLDDNKLAARCEQACCKFTVIVCKYQVSTSLIFTDLLQPFEHSNLLQLVDNLQQSGKIRNLQEICGVCGCVDHTSLFSCTESNSCIKGLFI